MTLPTMQALRHRQYEERIDLIIAHLRRSHTVMQAADRLGIDRAVLYRDMRDSGRGPAADHLARDLVAEGAA